MTQQKIALTYCGMQGTGATVAKAKQDAARKLEALMNGDWTPHLLVHHGWYVIVCRTPAQDARQWGYKLFQLADGSQELWLSGTWETRDAALIKAAHHLAQCAGTYVGLERWLSTAEQRDLDRYFLWQADYAAAKAEGLTDQECRDRANIRFFQIGVTHADQGH